MPAITPRHTKEELSRRGKEIFGRVIQQTLRPEDRGKYVAIDIESEDYAIDKDDYTATARLLQQRPDAQMWLMQVGEIAAYRIGARSSAKGAE